MRLSIAVLALVAACGSPSAQRLVELDAQAPDAADYDASLDDAGEVLDEGALDAGVAWDAGADAGMRDLGTDAGRGYDGECTLVPQSGCAPGEACRLQRVSMTFVSACESVGYYALAEGQSLPHTPGSGLPYACRDASGDACAAGLFCMDTQCRRYCVVGGDPGQCPTLTTGSGDPLPMRCELWYPEVSVGLCVPAP